MVVYWLRGLGLIRLISVLHFAVAKGKCPLDCFIVRSDDKEAGCDYAKPFFDSQRSFLVRFEVDDPDEPHNNPR